MKLFLHATAFLSSFLVFSHALLVPPSTSLETSNSNIKSVAGSIGPHHVSIHFSTPCEECFIGTDSGLEFTLDVDEANTECSGSNLRLNGVPLSLSWSSPKPNSVIGAGDLALPTRLSNGLGEREYYTKWSLICLEQEATFIEVRLYRTGGEDGHILSGFTASFKQTGQPAVIKLEPRLRMPFKEIDHDAWRSPARDERLVILPTLSPQLPSGFPTELEEEFHKLQKLKAEAADLEDQIKNAQAGFMKKFWKAEFADCSTWRCYLTTALRDAPMFAKLIAHHFRHHDKIDESFFKESSHRNCSDKLDTVKAPQDQAPVAAVAEVPPPPPAEPFSFDHASPGPASPKIPSDPDAPTLPDMPEVPSAPEPPAAVESVSESKDAPFPFLPPWMTHDHKDGPPPWAHHGPPPWVKDGGSPPWGQGPPPWVKDGSSPPWGKGPPPWARPDFHNPPEGRPPWLHHHHPQNHGLPPFGAGFLSLDQQWKYRLIAAITSFAVVILFAICLFTCVRRRIKIFRDPRRRAECAARREERATRRAYKKAACKHKWRTIVNRFRRTEVTSDYEEKQELLRTKETGDENIVGEQIGNLRAAHNFIGELMRAEEGQSRTRTQGPAAGADAGERGSIRSEMLPAYSTTAPPDYAVDVPGDISVIDGFTGYTPSGADDTPESSVIDCSPRMSFETQRTTFTRVSQE